MIILMPELAWAVAARVTTDILLLSTAWFGDEFADKDSWSLFGVFSSPASDFELALRLRLIWTCDLLGAPLETETTSSLSLLESESSSGLL